MPSPLPDRRDFLKRTGIAGIGMAGLGLGLSANTVEAADAAPATKPATKPAKAATKPAKPIVKVSKNRSPLVIAIIGTSGRGTEVGITFAESPDAIVKYVCDVDSKHAIAASKAIGAYQDSDPTPIDDLRRVLDDKSVDAVAIATPDHWHAPAAILAIQAGKHAYVEKPCCHNPAEGEMLVAAARKHKRIVQHGTQRRSWPKVVEAIQRVRAGEFGNIYLSRGWYNNSRPETGKRTPAPVPAELNWDLWQGPAPRTDFTENVVHYKWHWFWRWGTGELGNNGVHALDVCRWGLGVDFPHRVTAGGGRYHFKDEQETPDTLGLTLDFGDKSIFWEGRSCHPLGFEGSAFGVAFYGDKATVVIDGGGYKLLDAKGKPMLDKPITGPAKNTEHVENFLAAIRDSKVKLACEIEEGYKTALLCHLGNIAYRTGSTVNCDPKTGHIVSNPEAEKLWTREYDPKWKPTV